MVNYINIFTENINHSRSWGPITIIIVVNSSGGSPPTLTVSVSVSCIHSNQRDVGAWGTMHELVIQIVRGTIYIYIYKYIYTHTYTHK